ncbi:Cystathionine gamma-synthase [Marasmius crinis-equi]|uniref:Cystathionine gamma-synthase n=1 Tax=Marasmius crinis-equi TaxID=585013 RepID=A0ABR3F5H1_9AGAR
MRGDKDHLTPTSFLSNVACQSDGARHVSHTLQIFAEIQRNADQHGFLVIVDETVGNFVNTTILQYADVVCTSLSKLFNGSANVLGGSLVINPDSRHYESIRNHLVETFINFYSEDVVVMENSRDFVSRIRTINANAMAAADLLRSPSLSFQTQPCATLIVIKDAAFRGLEQFRILSLIKICVCGRIVSVYDPLQCVKALMIGSDFTLAIPYAILAHFRELEVVKKYGIDETMVRLSVGTEELDVIMGYIRNAPEVAEKTLD